VEPPGPRLADHPRVVPAQVQIKKEKKKKEEKKKEKRRKKRENIKKVKREKGGERISRRGRGRPIRFLQCVRDLSLWRRILRRRLGR